MTAKDEGDVVRLRLQDAWRECERHVHHMQYALSSLGSVLPLTGKTFSNLAIDSVDELLGLLARIGEKTGIRE